MSVLFLGSNGHAATRLDAAREAWSRLGAPPLVEAPYPGFEGRPRAPSIETFLAAIEPAAATARLVYGHGIGALFALGLRARGALAGIPIVLQGPVVWSLAHRRNRRLARLAPLRMVVPLLFGTPAFQRRFVASYFTHPPAETTAAGFFDGYRQCTALGDLFAWCTPRLLDDLARRLVARPSSLEHITVWWGARDRVVDLRELSWTEAKLRVAWPRRDFADWGHYPMIDEPAAWARTLAEVARPSLTRPEDATLHR